MLNQKVVDLYFRWSREKEGVAIIDRTVTNYIHTILVAGILFCCFTNSLMIGCLLLVVLSASMIIRNLTFAYLYREYYFHHYSYEKRGSKFSFRDPRRFDIVRKEGDKIE